MMTPSGSSPIAARIAERAGRSALDGARKLGGGARLDFGDGPDMDFDLGDVDTDMLNRLLEEEQEDPPAERIREGRARPDRPAQQLVAAEQYSRAVAFPAWEELTETESGYLLRHDGRLFAAREIDAEGVVASVFASPRLQQAVSKAVPEAGQLEPVQAEAPSAPKPKRKRNAKGHYVKGSGTMADELMDGNDLTA